MSPQPIRKKTFFTRLLGRCDTKPPADTCCWTCHDSRIEITLARAAELSEPGGAVRLEGCAVLDRVLIVHGHDGVFHALRNDCPHGGRRIDPLPGKPLIECCSIGKSTFDYTGKVVSGTAREPLRVFPVEQTDGKLIIRLE